MSPQQVDTAAAGNRPHFQPRVSAGCQRRLATFIPTALDVAEAEGGGLRLRRERGDLGDLVSGLLSLYEAAFTERHQQVRVHLADHVRVPVDASLLRLADERFLTGL